MFDFNLGAPFIPSPSCWTIRQHLDFLSERMTIWSFIEVSRLCFYFEESIDEMN